MQTHRHCPATVDADTVDAEKQSKPTEHVPQPAVVSEVTVTAVDVVAASKFCTLHRVVIAEMVADDAVPTDPAK